MDRKYILKDADLQDAVELTKTLVAIPTESPEGEHYEEFIDVLEREIRVRVPSLKLERLVVPMEAYEDYPERRAAMKGPRVVLLARAAAPGRPKIHINDHYDVVKAGDPSKWTFTGPYDPKVIDGRLYGRGACDPKGSVASVIEALKIIEREGLALNYDLTLSFTPDEEVGGYTGLTYMVEETRRGNPLIEGDFFFSLDGAQNYISNGKTGLINFSVEVQGTSTHISRSFTGANAIHLAVPVLHALLELKERVEQKASKWPVNPELPLGYVHPNLSVTMINGGFSAEAIPDRCSFVGDRSVLPDETMADAQNELVSVLLGVKQKYQIPMKFTVNPALPAFVTPEDQPGLQRLRQVATRGGRKPYPVACSEGYNDISIVTGLGLPIFGRGVQREDSKVHAYNENVKVEYIGTAIEDLVAFLTR